MCPPGSLHHRLVKDWPYVRSYLLNDGRLFLSLMADAGIYEFEPMRERDIEPGPIQGTAMYRERIALPRDAVFEATLEDASPADARSEVIARIRNEQPGHPPIAFVISYDRSRLDPNHTYVVRARILAGGKPWFTTDQHYPVLTTGQDNKVQLLLRRVGAGGRPAGREPDADSLAPPGPSPAQLENTYWKLISLPDAPVTWAEQRQEPHFVLHPADKRVTGWGGCNRLTGNYEADLGNVSFGRIVTTQMACNEGMETEMAFLDALAGAGRWRVTDQRLELLDGAGNLLARFEARYMK